MTCGWVPSCAVCVLIGLLGEAADTSIGGDPVCEAHAGLLLTEGLRGAASIAARDVGRRIPWLGGDA